MIPHQEPLPPIPGYRHFQHQHLISRLEGSGNYTLVHVLGNTNPLVVSQTLKRFENEWPQFIRISKSSLVNPRYIDRLIRKDAKVVYVKLIDGHRLSVSRRRIPQTLARLGHI